MPASQGSKQGHTEKPVIYKMIDDILPDLAEYSSHTNRYNLRILVCTSECMY